MGGERSSALEGSGRILSVESGQEIAAIMGPTLAEAGYTVHTSASAVEAFDQARARRPDLILLNVPLPDDSGFALCRRLRHDTDLATVGVIIVTERSGENDRLLGFEMGADDYVTKPFLPRELLARIRAVIGRRRSALDSERMQELRIGDLEVSRWRFEVRSKGRLVDVTRREFDLLATLMGAPGRVFGREELLDLVWGSEVVSPRVVDVHVARLRRRFTKARLPQPAIETIRGVGYRFRDVDSA